MAETLCNLRKYGGGKLKETVLWTNSSPTSSFGTQTIILSDSILNYKYLRAEYTLSTSNATTFSILVDANEFYNKAVNSQNYPLPFLGGTVSGRTYTRPFLLNNPSNALKIDILDSILWNGTGAVNSNLIPTQIIGLK